MIPRLQFPEFTALSRGDRWLCLWAAIGIVALGAELFWPHPLQTVAAHAEGPTARAVDAAVWQPAPRLEYQLITERPLFTVDRRPFVPPTEVQVDLAPAPPPVQFELSAILTSGGTQVALLKTSTSSGSFKVRLNETVQGWMLVEVRADSVVLRQGADTIVVELQPERGLVGRAELNASGSIARGQ